jgi:hypothetical protein
MVRAHERRYSNAVLIMPSKGTRVNSNLYLSHICCRTISTYVNHDPRCIVAQAASPAIAGVNCQNDPGYGFMPLTNSHSDSLVGRVTPCAPVLGRPPANGAHGVTRPTLRLIPILRIAGRWPRILAVTTSYPEYSYASPPPPNTQGATIKQQSRLALLTLSPGFGMALRSHWVACAVLRHFCCFQLFPTWSC